MGLLKIDQLRKYSKSLKRATRDSACLGARSKYRASSSVLNHLNNSAILVVTAKKGTEGYNESLKTTNETGDKIIKI